MFRAIISPILRAAGHQEAASLVHFTTSCKHRLVLLRMGEIMARNMLSWLKLLIQLLLLHPVGCLYEGESNENPKYIYFYFFYHGRYCVLIHDSYPDVQLFHLLSRGDFPSQWLQLLQWSLVSLLGVPDQFEESLLQNWCRSWTS